MHTAMKWLLGIILGVLLLATTYSIFKLSRPECYDGYGSAYYVDKTELLSKLNSMSTEKELLYWGNLNLTSQAMESFRCGDTTYSIKEGEKWKEVGKRTFDAFREQSNENTLRIQQSGNSPFFVEDVTDGKNYVIGTNESTYVLMPSR